jgi:hypothetical protein
MLFSRPLKPAVLTGAFLCTLITGSGAVAEIPPIGDFSGTMGANPQELGLFWSTPLFELPEGECYYDFRYLDSPLTEDNWDTAPELVANIPPVAADPQVAVELHFNVAPAKLPGDLVSYTDRAHLTAYLTRTVGPLWPGGPYHESCLLAGREIKFYYKRRNASSFQYLGSDHTPVAEYVTGDLTNVSAADGGEWFTFRATWLGDIYTLQGGLVSLPEQSVEMDLWMCEGYLASPNGHWLGWGGVYDVELNDVALQFIVPGGAVEGEVEVQVYAPEYVPPPVGMNAAVPGAMTAFQVEKADGPFLQAPITVVMQYREYMLEEYGGLGESSLRPYRYDEDLEQWELLDQTSRALDRDQHNISFITDRLGLFAVAAETDADGDGLGDVEELEFETEPGIADSDDDGASDGDELWFFQGDPRDPLKVFGEDQYCWGTSPEELTDYWVAARIVSETEQSPISNSVHIYFCLGDLDGDGDIDLADLAQLLSNYGTTGGAAYEDGDLDGDGDVDLADLAGLLAVYGTTCP